MTDQPKKEFNPSDWPSEKVLLLKLAEIQLQIHRILVAGTEVIKSARVGTKATANVTRSSLAALGIELQRTAQIKWPVRKPSLWQRIRRYVTRNQDGNPNDAGQPRA